MNTMKLAPALAGGLTAAVIAVGLATPASADYDTSGYINALDAAGLIDHDGDHCNIIMACATANSMTALPLYRPGYGSASKSSRAGRAAPSSTTSATARA